jgi:hypothetical protein
MADLASILKDPNYINANEATKAAIFEKWAPQDPNFANANAATQDAIRQKFGLTVAAPAATAKPTVSTAVPVPVQPELSTAQKVYKTGREVLGPTVEALGAAGGAVLGGTAGTFGAGPVGTVLGGVTGAGLGYATTKEALHSLDVLAGIEKPRQGVAQITEPVKNVLEGATMEAGGQAAGQMLAKGAGKVMDILNRPTQKAAQIAQNALTSKEDIAQAVNALRNAKPGQSVAEVTAGIQNPAWQSLVRESLQRSPSGAQYLSKFAKMSEQESINALTKLAGGNTAAEARGTVEQMKQNLNSLTTPQREAALNRANLGKAVADYELQAGQLSKEAAAEVQKVRDLISAGNSAEAWARLQLIKQGKPVGLTKYTYSGQLAEKAFGEWSSKAADASLDLGQGARFAQSAADALRSSGIKPLEGEALAGSVKSVLNNPEFAGNDLLAGAAKNVADDIMKWTNGGGVIDARALDAIRKNSVNATIQQLRPGMDATTQRNLAAGVLSKIKPVLDNAIEAAGGEGYKQYLADYAKGMQRVNEKKLTGEALRLWKTDKDAFVRLVQNESPETVEKFLGPGNYNIATELADDTMKVLQDQAQKRITQLSVDAQATEGKKALTTILNQNMSKFRLPALLNVWGAATNKALSELEKAAGAKTMKILADSMQSPQAAADLLETLPAQERNKVLQLITNPEEWMTAKKAVTGTVAGATNQLAPENRNKNSMRVELRGMANKD